MCHKNSPELLEHCDLFCLKKFFEFKKDIANFQNTILKTYLETCNFKIHCTKTANLLSISEKKKSKYINGFKIFS